MADLLSNTIIDVLMNTGDNETSSFTVNNAVTNVSLVAPNGNGIVSRADLRYIFDRLDHFQILSIGCVLPLGFEFWENDIAGDFRGSRVNMSSRLSPAGTGKVIEPPVIWLPYQNYEMSLGIYNNLNPAEYTQDFFLEMTWETGAVQQISMVGVPDALQGEVFHVPLYCKVLHTLPLLVLA